MSVFAPLSDFHSACCTVCLESGSSQYYRAERAFFWQHNKCCVFFSPINTASHTHKHTHPSVPPTPLSPFVFLGSPHLQTYYPESSAAAQLALRCWSVLLVTSAPSARSARLRSSGISPMENLNRIQKKPVHTSNCDRVFHQLNCSFFCLVPG